MSASQLILASALLVLFNFLHLNGQQLNDECTFRNGTKGVCINIRNCPPAIDLLRNRTRPETCSFSGKYPIVCCGHRPRIGEISEQKCKEFYKEFTYPPIQVESNSGNLRKERAAEENLNPMNMSSTEPNTVYLVVAGGEDARAANYIHMAALGYGSLSNPNWSCGGSLISRKFVLTAAHCIESRALGRVKFVRLGDLDLKSTTDLAEPQTINVSRIIAHPSYRPPVVYNDIALLELETPAVISKFVRPACLQTKKIITDTRWVATGWGRTSFQGESADHLQDVVLREFTLEQCQAAFKGESARRLSRGIDGESQICAGENKKDTCQGDSGGPLQVSNEDYFIGYTIIGVTSFGKACAIATTPAVYTRVSHYIGWIESVVWPN